MDLYLYFTTFFYGVQSDNFTFAYQYREYLLIEKQYRVRVLKIKRLIEITCEDIIDVWIEHWAEWCTVPCIRLIQIIIVVVIIYKTNINVLNENSCD